MTAPPVQILVVDDDVLLSRAVKRMLAPHAVTIANSGIAALEEISARDFDIILCDIMMPELSGPEFFHRLAENHPELQQRVMFITGGALEKVQPMMADIPNRVIEKPFTRGELMQVVDQFLAVLSRS